MEELRMLKEEFERCKNQQISDDGLYISPTARDWKEIMDWQIRNGWRKFNSVRPQIEKFGGWQENRIKFRSHYSCNAANKDLSKECYLAKRKPGCKIYQHFF